MTQAELQQLVETISLVFFQRPFQHWARINPRMTTTGGRYHLKDHHLEINAHFLAPAYRQILIGIIKHELTHYHLHLRGKGYRHQDHDFKVLLAQVGGSRWTPDIGLARHQSIHYEYQCPWCHQHYFRVRRLNLHRYVCGHCHHSLVLLKKVQ